MKSYFCRLCLALLLLGAPACFDAPRVVQGQVLSYDSTSKILVVKDERPPNQELSFSLEKAEIGALPAKGDIVRIAFHEAGSNRSATRVANLTRQAEIGGKALKKH
jgi:hypothetical protein